MIKDNYEVKEHIVVDKVLVSRQMFCDVCEKEITKGVGYYEVTTHHNDWGNDSIDSYDYSDVCSVECLKKKFDEY